MIPKAINFLETGGSIRIQPTPPRSGRVGIILLFFIGLIFLAGIGLILAYFDILSIPWIEQTLIPWIRQWIAV